jgi:hypothetical protein
MTPNQKQTNKQTEEKVSEGFFLRREVEKKKKKRFFTKGSWVGTKRAPKKQTHKKTKPQKPFCSQERTISKMLWVDKHRPNSLVKLDFHKEQGLQLSQLVKLETQNSPFILLILILLLLLLLLFCMSGDLRRVSTFVDIWTFWSRKEDAGDGIAEGVVWGEC